MPKMQIRWPEISNRLVARLEACPLTHSELAAASGADYHAVRRMRRDGIENQSKNTRLLCSYFGISGNFGDPVESKKALTGALKAAWDGSPGHAQFLAELLTLGASFQVSTRPPPSAKPSRR
jgi:hypothetical protein